MLPTTPCTPPTTTTTVDVGRGGRLQMGPKGTLGLGPYYSQAAPGTIFKLDFGDRRRVGRLSENKIFVTSQSLRFLVRPRLDDGDSDNE